MFRFTKAQATYLNGKVACVQLLSENPQHSILLRSSCSLRSKRERNESKRKMACNVKMSDLANIKIASEQVQLYLRVLKVYQCNTPELHKIEQSKRLIKLWRYPHK